MNNNFKKFSKDDLFEHHNAEFDKINIRIEEINLSYRKYEIVERPIIYSWPRCFMSFTENGFDLPLYETIHILFDFETKSFYLAHGYDEGCSVSDHVEHHLRYIHHDSFDGSLNDALSVGSQLFVNLQLESEEVIDKLSKPYSDGKCIYQLIDETEYIYNS